MAHNYSTKQNTMQPLAEFRNALKNDLAQLKTAFFEHKNVQRSLKQQRKTTDQLLLKLWQQAQIDHNVGLFAVGGYGRGELFPYSDIDLLILLPNQPSDYLLSQIEQFIMRLWDIGLNIGHSVRNLEACIEEAQNDSTTLTNLSEARFLAGNQRAFNQLSKALNTLKANHSYLHAKIREQALRHAKFEDTAYSLEPNIKESPGGLRDAQMILWLGQSVGKGDNWKSLASNGVISAKTAQQIQKHVRFLEDLRMRLHFLAGRREDRLLFDYQYTLADVFGFKSNQNNSASEQLMQRYYRSANFIRLMNEITLKSFSESIQKPKQEQILNDFWIAKNGLLYARQADLLSRHPAAILEAFLMLQRHPELTDMSADLLQQIQQTLPKIDYQFRQNQEHQRLFLDILAQKNGVNHTLRRMNRYNVLGRYIPAFGKIVGQMQHDLFHVYTVDAHILNVLANLRRFSKRELSHEFPLCSRLFTQFPQPYLLYLAALFHDIAKGRGGDHSDLGKVDAQRFCRLHRLTKEDTELVTWLVEAHLKMSHTAQKTDLSDPETIADFAQFVGDEKRLTALYLLTVADIRGTSPHVWNAWKARLLESLYFQTLNVLKTNENTAQLLDLRKTKAEEKLLKYGLRKDSIATLWNTFGEGYFSRFDADEIAWQTRLLLPHLHSKKAVVRARLSPFGDGIQVMIYDKDEQALFAKICQFFDSIGMDIAQAKIFTTAHGYALDYFLIIEQEVKQVSYTGLLNYIEANLSNALNSEPDTNVRNLMNTIRQVKHMPIEPEILIEETNQPSLYKLDIVTNNRVGLLFDIANVFLTHDIVLHHAKINTLGNRVEDSFLIQPLDKQDLTVAKQQKIKTDILGLTR